MSVGAVPSVRLLPSRKVNMLKYEGELLIDPEKGTIRFRSHEVGRPILRIINLPVPIPDPLSEYPDVQPMLDVHHMVSASWKGKRLQDLPRPNFDV